MINNGVVNRDSRSSDTARVRAGGFGSVESGRSLINGPDHSFMRLQMPVWNFLMDHYFRMEMDGWQRLPQRPSLLVGVHSGGSLTMDAWTVVFQWYRRFGGDRILHGT